MKDVREFWYDPVLRVAVTFADATSAAQALAQGHLSGPAAAHCLAKALAAAALLGRGLEGEETLSVQMKCTGPLGGLNVECTAAGTLRGYTERKTLDGFDGMGEPDEKLLLGETRFQVTRSLPGKIVSQGISASLDGYLAGSLQRKACIRLSASVTDDAQVLQARGILVEAMPDSDWNVFEGIEAVAGKWRRAGFPAGISGSPRNILAKMGLKGAERKESAPLSFACRCSPERAAAMVAAVPEEERAAMPPAVDVTCHMCGRTFTVSTGGRG